MAKPECFLRKNVHLRNYFGEYHGTGGVAYIGLIFAFLGLSPVNIVRLCFICTEIYYDE